MAFISTAFASRFPQTNNQLRTSSNPRNQATIQDGRVTVQTVQGRQTQGYTNNGARPNTTTRGTTGSVVGGQGRVVKCYNCQEEGHYARQCTKPKRPKNSAWFKKKLMLTKALELGAYLDPEQLAFLAGNGDTFVAVQASQEIPTSTAFQTDDLDAFDLDCDDAPSAKAVLMANLSSYDSHVLSEVQNHDMNIESDMSYLTVQEAQCSEQPFFNNDTDINITSDNNIISYEQYLQKTKTLVVQSTSSTAQQDELLMSVIDEMQSQVAKCNKVQQENKIVNETLSAKLERYKEQIKIYEQRKSFELNDREKYIDGQLRQVIVDRNAKVADFKKEIHSLKLQLNATVESHKTLSTTVEILKEASKQKEDKYLDEIIDLQKDKKALDNVVYKMEKKVSFAHVDYVALNKLSEHFMKHFVPQKQLSVEQAFWLPISQPVSEKQQIQLEPVFKKELPRELPSISIVKDSFNKMRNHLNKFKETITFHTKITGNRIGSWGVEHIKGAFEKDVKPFTKTLREYFQMFDQGIHKGINAMKEVFQQMETEVTKCQVDRKCFKIEKKELILESERLLEHIICQDVMNVDNVLPMPANFLNHDNSALETLVNENDRLMELLISQDIVHTHLYTLVAINDSNSMKMTFIGEYNENLKLKAELAKKNDMVEQAVYNELSKQSKLNAKDQSIAKLREHIANLKGKNKDESDHNVQNSDVVTSRVYKLDLSPLSPRVKNNREEHVAYLKHLEENAKILREIVEHARELRPFDSDLESASMHRTRKVRFAESASTSEDKSQKKANTPNKQTPNNAMLPSTGIKRCTEASGSKPKSNTRNDRISQPSSSNKKTNKVEAQPRIVEPCLKTKNRVTKPVLNANVYHTVLSANSHLVCSSCNECLFDAIHDLCVSNFISDMHARSKSVKSKKKKTWKCTGKMFNTVGYRWIPTRRTFTINGNKCPLTRITPNSKVTLKKPVTSAVVKPATQTNSRPNRLMVPGFELLQAHDRTTISTHQFCQQISRHDGTDLISRSRDTNLYTISLDDMLKTSPICLLSKASKTKSWLWHRRLSHLNFGTLNQLAKYGLARGIPKLKYQKDHLCSACALGKSKRSSHTPKSQDTNQVKLNLLHMDLYGPMCVESINGKKCILLKLISEFLLDMLSQRMPFESITGEQDKSWKLSGPAPQLMTPGYISSGLFFNPLKSVVSHVPIVVAQRLADPTSSPSSMLNDQDAPSTSVSSTREPVKSLTISPVIMEMNQTSHFDDPCHENLHDVSTSPSANVQLQPASFESTPIQNSLHRDTSSQESSSNVQPF
ncbi:retrovirus-related pol polyprotein from transposon TNT 1-94 [Tanacetum coccineum]|uniref:Retrovirus-related pol polyprotein from transposon TNT 1-94 n=1 Tax=Tanacetum coccineum TaxID=301880 RepID=A0ABQ5C6Z4_9ASTR